MRNDFESNYLAHWGIAKGQKAKNHKYFERVEQNGRYLYFYTQAEYDAWLHRGQKGLDAAKNKTKNALNKIKSTISNTRQGLMSAISKGQQGITNSIVKAQKTLTKSNAQQVINRGNKTVTSLLNKVSNKTSNTAKEVTSNASKAIQKYTSKGQQSIQKALKKSGNMTVGEASKKTGSKGQSIISKAIQKVKDVWDYDITGKGYVRNAREGWKDASEKFHNANAYENYSKRTDEENNKAWADYWKAEADARENEKFQKSYYKNALIPRIKKAAEDFEENVAYTVSQGERKIAQLLRNTKDKTINALEKNANDRDHYYSMDSTLEDAVGKHGKVGSGIITSILATAAATAVVALAKYAIANREEIADKVKSVVEKIFPPKEEKQAKPVEQPPKEFASDASDTYKENRAAHSDIPQKKGTSTRDDDMEAINPNRFSPEVQKQVDEIVSDYYAAVFRGDAEEAEKLYDELMALNDKYEGYMQNCANCTLAYDLRRRGYDVDAAWNPSATDVQSITEWYNLKNDDILGVDKGEGNRISRSEAKQLKQQIESMYPDGSYGHMLLYWTDGGGHDVVWSIENGDMVIRDCQSNEIVKAEDYLTKCSAMDMFRADDKELTDKAYNVANADKANFYGDTDNDEDYDNYWANHDEYEDDGKVSVKTDKDLNYEKYWKKAAGKKKR